MIRMFYLKFYDPEPQYGGWVDLEIERIDEEELERLKLRW